MTKTSINLFPFYGNSAPEKSCRFIQEHKSQFPSLSKLLHKRLLDQTEQETENINQNTYQEILLTNLNPSQKQLRKDSQEIPQDNLIKIPQFKTNNRANCIDKNPFKVLDAPFLQDDYYLNVLDWGNKNNLIVGLGSTAYIWNFQTTSVQKLTQFDNFNIISSTVWNTEGDRTLIGTLTGLVQFWDVEKKVMIRSWNDHKERVGAMSIHQNLILTGSRDSKIHLYDLRSNKKVKTYKTHKQEICGLKWNHTGNYFASGGNDNKMFVYSPKTNLPLMKKTHKAAVKALDWSPRQVNLLATGAGTADRGLRTWHVGRQELVTYKDTGSQICQIKFSKNEQELISTHGFSTNSVNIWDYRDLSQITQLQGHSQRVLYLAMSPCGQFIVTGAGDETLRFWKLNKDSKMKPHITDNKIFSVKFPR